MAARTNAFPSLLPLHLSTPSPLQSLLFLFISVSPPLLTGSGGKTPKISYIEDPICEFYRFFTQKCVFDAAVFACSFCKIVCKLLIFISSVPLP
jgi:hypothetical protein